MQIPQLYALNAVRTSVSLAVCCVFCCAWLADIRSGRQPHWQLAYYARNPTRTFVLHHHHHVTNQVVLHGGSISKLSLKRLLPHGEDRQHPPVL
jgi:hypothetical protein